MGDYRDNRFFDPIHETGVDLGNGTYNEVGYLMNLDGEHWVAVALDFEGSQILYGDSFDGEPSKDLKEVLSWWTHLHTGREFTYGALDITRQQDGLSYGLLSWNPLGHWFVPEKYLLIDAEKVDDATLRVLLQVIDHHQD